MKDWIERLDIILQMNGRELLTNAGKISHKMAKERAEIEYVKYKEKKKEVQYNQNFSELVDDLKQLKSNNNNNKESD